MEKTSQPPSDPFQSPVPNNWTPKIGEMVMTAPKYIVHKSGKPIQAKGIPIGRIIRVLGDWVLLTGVRRGIHFTSQLKIEDIRPRDYKFMNFWMDKEYVG